MDPNSIPWYVWFVSGALTSLGILILLDDRLTNRITSRDNLGWLLLAAGLVLLIGWFLIPFFPVIWEAIITIWQQSTTTMLVALLVGVFLITIGVIMMRRRHNP